jgi:hypothetical protein
LESKELKDRITSTSIKK